MQVKGMRYFQCAPGHGIFVAARAVAKAGASYRPKEPETRSRAPQKARKKQNKLICQASQNGFLQVVHHGKVDVSHVQAKFHSAMAVIAERTEVLFYKLKNCNDDINNTIFHIRVIFGQLIRWVSDCDTQVGLD